MAKPTNKSNKDNGWIKLHRRLLDNPIVLKPKYCHLWITLLLKAAHTGNSFIWNGKKQVIRSGQVLTGREKLSEATGIKPSTIENILTYLESEQQIGQQKTQKFRIITIKNWEKYQFDNKVDSKMDNKLTTDGQQMDTYKNVKNVKNVKKNMSQEVFDYWNNYKGKSVCKLKDGREEKICWHGHNLRPDGTVSPEIEKAVVQALSEKYTVEDICQAIDNYAKVLLSADYWWTYPWPLSIFLTVKKENLKDADRKWWQFLQSSFIERNYLTVAAKQKKLRQSQGPTPYDLAKAQKKQEKDGIQRNTG